MKKNLILIVAVVTMVLAYSNPVFAKQIGIEYNGTISFVNVGGDWEGEILTKNAGTIEGPSGRETYYNLKMSKVIEYMKSLGYNYEYWGRQDGVKMYGPYVMCAASLDIRPKGTILETSLGPAIVCDTGDFAKSNKTQIDIAVDW